MLERGPRVCAFLMWKMGGRQVSVTELCSELHFLDLIAKTTLIVIDSGALWAWSQPAQSLTACPPQKDGYQSVPLHGLLWTCHPDPAGNQAQRYAETSCRLMGEGLLVRPVSPEPK